MLETCPAPKMLPRSEFQMKLTCSTFMKLMSVSENTGEKNAAQALPL